jgi:hypothetical protein
MRRTDLIVNGTSIDVAEDVSMPLTYAIADIKNPDVRQGSYSKTVRLPGSPSVNKLFDHIFDVNYTIQNTSATNFNPDFNPNLKASIVVTVDTAEQFRGYLRLRSIERDRQHIDRIYYNVELFGELGNLIELMGDAKLSDLSFSEYNHTYNRTNQKASWSVNYLQGYYYPMIQYGLNDGVNWKVEDFFPAIYAKQYWDKIFAYIGCYYSGSFASSDPFTKLVVPFTGESFKLTQSQVDARKFSATRTTTVTATGGNNFGSIAEPVVFDSEISDPDSQYNPATGYFTCVDIGNYEFVTTGEFFFEAVGGDVSGTGVNYLNVLFYHQRGATVTLLNGAAVWGDPSVTLFDGNRTTTKSYTYTSDTIALEVGDKVWVKLVPVYIAITGASFLKFTLSSGADFYNTVNNPAIFEGNTLDMSGAIPDDIRMADFFLSIVKEFNLMIEPNRTMPNTYVIDTADDFYASGTTRDWSAKLDTSKTVEILPMGALDARRYILKRTDGDDYFNKTYREEWGETYGIKKYDVSNDFLKNTNEFESIFTDTPLVGRNADDRVYPEIYTLDSSGNPKPTSSGIRLLYAGGAVATGYSWNYVTDGGTYSESTYPYAGHLDSVAIPTFDLCFDNPRQVFYNAISYTDNGMFNRYHSKYITEITDKQSRVINAWFYLKPLDIFRLSFRDPIYLDIQGISGYYRLHKVSDYNATKEGVTKCELLKIKDASPFVPTTYMISNYLNSTTSFVTGVASRPRVIATDSVVAGGTNTGNERNSGSIVGGYMNRLGAGAERIGIIGSSGVDVYPEIRGAVVIASNDVTITEDNTLYLGGIKQVTTDSIRTLTGATTIYTSGVYYCDGTFTVTLNNQIGNGGLVIIKNIGSGTITISGGGINIDDTASKTLTIQWSSYKIRYSSDNGKYLIE